MKPTIKKLTTLLLFLPLVSMLAQESQQASFSLQQAIDYALKNSPSQKNAEMDLMSAEYRRKEIAGIGLPQVSGSFDLKDYLRIPVSVIPISAFSPLAPPDTYTTVQFGVKYNATAGINASQLIFSSDYIYGLKASKEFMNLSRMSVIRSKSEVAAQVSKAYYNVLINKERIKLLDANIARLERLYNETKAYNQQGFAEIIDVERLEVAFNNLVTEKSKIERLIGLAEAMLKFQMGYNIQENIQLSDSLNIDNGNLQSVGNSQMDVSQRPEYKLLQSQQALLDIDAKRLKAGYLPTIAAYGAFQLNTQRTSLDIFTIDKTNPIMQWYRVGIIGVTVNLNIFDGFQRHYQIQQAKITAQKNVNTLRNFELGAQLEVASASIGFDNAVTSMQSQKRNMDLANHVYEVSQKKYKEGVGSNLEVITAETAMKEAQTNYLNAVYDLIVARVDYLKATGTLVK